LDGQVIIWAQRCDTAIREAALDNGHGLLAVTLRYTQVPSVTRCCANTTHAKQPHHTNTPATFDSRRQAAARLSPEVT